MYFISFIGVGEKILDEISRASKSE